MDSMLGMLDARYEMGRDGADEMRWDKMLEMGLGTHGQKSNEYADNARRGTEWAERAWIPTDSRRDQPLKAYMQWMDG